MEINAIPNNMEKYMAFMLGKHLVFIDSFQFTSSSLDKLASNLPDEAYKYTSEVFKDDKSNLMKKKGIYPYDYMDSFDKFYEKLSENNIFTAFLTMTMSPINNTNTNLLHVKFVWNAFNIKTVGEYHDL